jgi:hypothetical protein
VTGSHAIKAGFTFMHLWAWTSSDVVNNGMTLQLRKRRAHAGHRVRDAVLVLRAPERQLRALRAGPVDAQAAHVNAGVRFDALENIVPRQTIGPGPQVPTRNLVFDEVRGVPEWSDVTPRLGAAYDLFGNGRTAVKVSIGKYLEAPNPPTFTRPANPAGALVQSATRTWGIATTTSSAGGRARRDHADQLRHDQRRARATTRRC